VVSFPPLPLYPQRQSRRHSLRRSLDGSQSRSGCNGEKKIFLPARNRPARSVVAIPTELPRLKEKVHSIWGRQIKLFLITKQGTAADQKMRLQTSVGGSSKKLTALCDKMK
jgi:hypothetical protein